MEGHPRPETSDNARNQQVATRGTTRSQRKTRSPSDLREVASICDLLPTIDILASTMSCNSPWTTSFEATLVVDQVGFFSLWPTIGRAHTDGPFPRRRTQAAVHHTGTSAWHGHVSPCRFSKRVRRRSCLLVYQRHPEFSCKSFQLVRRAMLHDTPQPDAVLHYLGSPDPLQTQVHQRLEGGMVAIALLENPDQLQNTLGLDVRAYTWKMQELFPASSGDSEGVILISRLCDTLVLLVLLGVDEVSSLTCPTTRKNRFAQCPTKNFTYSPAPRPTWFFAVFLTFTQPITPSHHKTISFQLPEKHQNKQTDSLPTASDRLDKARNRDSVAAKQHQQDSVETSLTAHWQHRKHVSENVLLSAKDVWGKPSARGVLWLVGSSSMASRGCARSPWHMGCQKELRAQSV